MTPHSDEQILSLNKGLRARESKAMKRLVAASDVMTHRPGHTADRVVVFKNRRPANGVLQSKPADIIPLLAGRLSGAERNTDHGRLECVPEPTA